jgi:hypothetical protein
MLAAEEFDAKRLSADHRKIPVRRGGRATKTGSGKAKP